MDTLSSHQTWLAGDASVTAAVEAPRAPAGEAGGSMAIVINLMFQTTSTRIESGDKQNSIYKKTHIKNKSNT